MANLTAEPPAGIRSGLIIRVPEAEPIVGQWRQRLDSVASRGVPAHVTALFPFVAPADLTDDVLVRVAGIAAGTAPFNYRFSEIEWFADDVVFLAPDDPEPFFELTQLLWDAFPDCPPYGGEHDTVVPHLTIGDGHPLDELQEAEVELIGFEPIEGAATTLTMMIENDSGAWNLVQEWLFEP